MSGFLKWSDKETLSAEQTRENALILPALLALATPPNVATDKPLQ